MKKILLCNYFIDLFRDIIFKCALIKFENISLFLFRKSIMVWFDIGILEKVLPAKKVLSLFISYLENKGVVVKVRRSRGKDIDAACGQLANKNKS